MPWAEDRGIVSGYGDGTFKGDKEVTREELVVMLWNYAGKLLDPTGFATRAELAQMLKNYLENN